MPAMPCCGERFCIPFALVRAYCVPTPIRKLVNNAITPAVKLSSKKIKKILNMQ